jgi:hypothetical protein
MSIIHGTYKSGHVELDTPVDWPEGARVGILSPPREEETSLAAVPEQFGMSDADWPTTKEGIAALIAEWNAMEPLELTPEDEKEIEAAQKWIDNYSRAAVAKDMGLIP